MTSPISGQIALVFGASSGIGRATALALAQAGAAVVVASRNIDALEQVAGAIRREGGDAEAIAVDVADADQVKAAVHRVTEARNALNIVVNSAGVNTLHRGIGVLAEADWNRVVSLNLSGAFHTTQCAVRYMREHGGGLVVQISSG